MIRSGVEKGTILIGKLRSIKANVKGLVQSKGKTALIEGGSCFNRAIHGDTVAVETFSVGDQLMGKIIAVIKRELRNIVATIDETELTTETKTGDSRKTFFVVPFSKQYPKIKFFYPPTLSFYSCCYTFAILFF